MSIHSYTGNERLPTAVTVGEPERSHGNGDRVSAVLAHGVDSSTAVHLAEIFGALSDPTRVRIVSLLVDAEQCVGDLAAALSLSQSAVSHQLRTLRNLRLVRWRREGQQIYYTLDDEHVVDLFRRGLDHAQHVRM